jgi:hypothetical protein
MFRLKTNRETDARRVLFRNSANRKVIMVRHNFFHICKGELS